MSIEVENILVKNEPAEETPDIIDVIKKEIDLAESGNSEPKEEEKVADINSWEYYSENDLLEYLVNTDPRKDEDESIIEQASLLSYIENAKITNESAEKIVEMLEEAYEFNIEQQEIKPYTDNDDLKIDRGDFNDSLTEKYGKEIYDTMVVTALRHIRDKTGSLVL